MRADRLAARSDPVFSISGLVTDFVTEAGRVRAVDHVSYALHAGEVLGVVGESGSGKSATVLSALRLVSEPPAQILAGEVWFKDTNLLSLPPEALRQIRGNNIGMVFQDPMTSLNPVLTIGRQIEETIAAHRRGSSRSDLKDEKQSSCSRSSAYPTPIAGSGSTHMSSPGGCGNVQWWRSLSPMNQPCSSLTNRLLRSMSRFRLSWSTCSRFRVVRAERLRSGSLTTWVSWPRSPIAS